MAKKKPDLRVASNDPIEEELEQQIRANAALLQGLKEQYSQALLDSLSGGGDPPEPARLSQIKSLELTLQNDRMFLAARRLTRR